MGYKRLQCVVRTYPFGDEVTTEFLERKLAEGCWVEHITPLQDGSIEYILSQYVDDGINDAPMKQGE